MPHADVSGQHIRFEDGGGDTVVEFGGPDLGDLTAHGPVNDASLSLLAGLPG